MSGPLSGNILERIRQQDAVAFAALYENAAPKLFGLAIRLLKREDLAEEVVHDLFVTLWQSPPDLGPSPQTLMAWMTTVVRNRSIDVLRKHGERALPEPDTAAWRAAEAATARDTREAEVARLTVATLMAELDEDSRVALLLAYREGMTHEEIAARMAVPVGTVKSRIRRALTKLRGRVEP